MRKVELKNCLQPYYPPTSGINQGVRAQYHCAGFCACTCPSTNALLLRPSWRGNGPPQFGSSGDDTHPTQGESLATSCRIQHPGFWNDCAVTHCVGSGVFFAAVPPSAIATVAAGLTTFSSLMPRTSHVCGHQQHPSRKFAP